jgi:hypothetical protein
MGTNITCSTNCNYRVAVTPHSLEPCLFTYIIANVLRICDDDDGDDDDDDDNTLRMLVFVQRVLVKYDVLIRRGKLNFPCPCHDGT